MRYVRQLVFSLAWCAVTSVLLILSVKNQDNTVLFTAIVSLVPAFYGTVYVQTDERKWSAVVGSKAYGIAYVFAVLLVFAMWLVVFATTPARMGTGPGGAACLLAIIYYNAVAKLDGKRRINALSALAVYVTGVIMVVM